jgi:hypothetical protein
MTEGPTPAPSWAAAPARGQLVTVARNVSTRYLLTRLISSGTVLAVVLQAAAGARLYVALFVVARGRRDRALYTSKVKALLSRRQPLASAV